MDSPQKNALSNATNITTGLDLINKCLDAKKIEEWQASNCSNCSTCSSKCFDLDPVLDHAPQQLSQDATAHLDSLFDQIEHEARKRSVKRCLYLLSSYLGEDGRSAFLKTSQPDLGYRIGAEILNDDPSALLEMLENKFSEEGIL